MKKEYTKLKTCLFRTLLLSTILFMCIIKGTAQFSEHVTNYINYIKTYAKDDCFTKFEARLGIKASFSADDNMLSDTINESLFGNLDSSHNYFLYLDTSTNFKVINLDMLVYSNKKSALKAKKMLDKLYNDPPEIVLSVEILPRDYFVIENTLFCISSNNLITAECYDKILIATMKYLKNKLHKKKKYYSITLYNP